MIELVDATVGSGEFLLTGLSIQVQRGEYVVVMGKTGIGKTTILETICGLRKLRAGSIFIEGQNVTNWSTSDRNVGYVPQDLALFTTMTVQQHLEFAMKLRRLDRAEIARRVREFASLLRIEGLLDRRTKGLSGGEAQRVALGRALTFGPSVLLLDEPLSALDADTREAAQAMLREINRKTGVTVLHVTHSPEEAQALADRTIGIESEQGVARISTL